MICVVHDCSRPDVWEKMVRVGKYLVHVALCDLHRNRLQPKNEGYPIPDCCTNVIRKGR